MCLSAKWSSKVFLLVLIIMFFLPSQAFTLSTWDIGGGESMLEGLLLSCHEEHVLIGTKNGIRTLALSSHPFTAISGRSSGYIVRPADFPLLIKVELIMDRHGKIRAMRNKQEIITTPPGQELHVSGHNAILSTDGEHYLLYHSASGLFLHSITNEYSPIFLSKSPLAAWNRESDKVACFFKEKILIYDVLKRSRTLLDLPSVDNGLVRVLTGLEWSPTGEKLMYTSLEDYPDMGSEVFFIRIIDQNGKTLRSKVVTNILKAFWQKEQIMFVCASDLSPGFFSVSVWDTQQDKLSILLPLKKGAYLNTTYNPVTDCLAYTTSGGYAENLHIMDCTKGAAAKIMSLPFPARNLQWSKKNTLFFSEELNNIIYEVSKNVNELYLTAQATGCLPLHCVAKNFLYFEAEPFEEPQPLFISRSPE